MFCYCLLGPELISISAGGRDGNTGPHHPQGHKLRPPELSVASVTVKYNIISVTFLTGFTENVHKMGILMLQMFKSVFHVYYHGQK